MGLSSHESSTGQSRTKVERSDRELIVTRTFDAPARLLFRAWTTPELFMRWWAPKSSGMLLRTCAMDVRVGGKYRLEFARDASHIMAFFGTYLEVEPDSRIAWTNEETDDGPVTSVTFAETNGKTLLTFNERYASKEALDEAFVGMEGGMPEQLDQLDELLASLGEP